MTAPGDHRLPPPGGYTGALATTRIPKERTWFRLYRHPYAPLHFGTTRRARFDAARGEFGVLYAARQIAGAFVETLARGGVRTISQERLQRYRVAEIAASRAVSLVDLTGRGLVRMGVDGPDHERVPDPVFTRHRVRASSEAEGQPETRTVPAQFLRRRDAPLEWSWRRYVTLWVVADERAGAVRIWIAAAVVVGVLTVALAAGPQLSGTGRDIVSAAERGSPHAQYGVGLAYLFGRMGAPKDYMTAAEWLQRAAEQDHSSSASCTKRVRGYRRNMRLRLSGTSGLPSKDTRMRNSTLALCTTLAEAYRRTM